MDDFAIAGLKRSESSFLRKVEEDRFSQCLRKATPEPGAELKATPERGAELEKSLKLNCLLVRSSSTLWIRKWDWEDGQEHFLLQLNWHDDVICRSQWAGLVLRLSYTVGFHSFPHRRSWQTLWIAESWIHWYLIWNAHFVRHVCICACVLNPSSWELSFTPWLVLINVSVAGMVLSYLLGVVPCLLVWLWTQIGLLVPLKCQRWDRLALSVSRLSAWKILSSSCFHLCVFVCVCVFVCFSSCGLSLVIIIVAVCFSLSLPPSPPLPLSLPLSLFLPLSASLPLSLSPPSSSNSLPFSLCMNVTGRMCACVCDYMLVCVYVTGVYACVYGCMHVRVTVSMTVSVWMWLLVCTCVTVCVTVYDWICMCVWLWVCMCVWLCMYVCVCACVWAGKVKEHAVLRIFPSR